MKKEKKKEGEESYEREIQERDRPFCFMIGFFPSPLLAHVQNRITKISAKSNAPPSLISVSYQSVNTCIEATPTKQYDFLRNQKLKKIIKVNI